MPHDASRKAAWRNSSIVRLLTGGIVVALVSILGAAWWKSHTSRKQPVHVAVIPLVPGRASGTPSPEAANCVACHASEVADWKASHHANANRLFNPETDSPAFHRGATFSAYGSKTILQADNGIATVSVLTPDGARTVYRPEAVIGVTPLMQYLLPLPGGRLQALNIS